MTYSCSDFTDDILNALGIVVPEEAHDDPRAQFELALTEIARLRQHVELLKRLVGCTDLNHDAVEPETVILLNEIDDLLCPQMKWRTT